MKRIVAFAVIVVVALTLNAAHSQQRSSTAGRLTIDKLIDIKHPSNPVWSRDNKKVAFIWERAGVQDLYVVAADGSAKPVAITTGGAAPNGVIWSADSKSLYFNRGGTMMQVSA